MIIVNLIGGLGNQMFQYAFGRSMEQAKQRKVCFDATTLLDRTPRENFTYRDFELGVFEGPVSLATPFDIALFRQSPANLLSRGYYKVQRALRKPSIYSEKQYYVYDPDVWRTGNNTYFDGYWQTEQYFLEQAALIRQAFAFRVAPTGENARLVQEIKSQVAISVHVRRGDYVSNSNASQMHNVCPPAYYEQAVRLLTSQIGEAVLYVFSDEPEWVCQHLRFELPTVYVSHNQGKNSFEDMRLMSLCQHHIIANSSFSWWGAWLNPNTTKRVIAPRQWLQTGLPSPTNLLPSQWIQL
jgi:hypothetical protein